MAEFQQDAVEQGARVLTGGTRIGEAGILGADRPHRRAVDREALQ
ncbi:hypothetical protein AB5I41_27325 [Sphingomonas sp. MMS24-JH45]